MLPVAQRFSERQARKRKSKYTSKNKISVLEVNSMKKIVSFILAVTMALTLCVALTG